MRICDIVVSSVRGGQNWRILNPDELFLSASPDAIEIEPADHFDEDDMAVYSALEVTDSGKVSPLLLVKRVGDYDYGGDYYVLRDGRWFQLGAVPEPDAEFSREFVASPPQNDPSFDSGEEDSLRALYREQFQKWAGKIEE